MIITLYLTYLTFVAIAFGSLVKFIWLTSHSAAILFGGFTVLSLVAKTLGEFIIAKKRENYLRALQAEYDKQQSHASPTAVTNSTGMN